MFRAERATWYVDSRALSHRPQALIISMYVVMSGEGAPPAPDLMVSKISIVFPSRPSPSPSPSPSPLLVVAAVLASSPSKMPRAQADSAELKLDRFGRGAGDRREAPPVAAAPDLVLPLSPSFLLTEL